MRGFSSICIRHFSALTGINPRNLAVPKHYRNRELTKQEQYALHQKRKHAPRLPASIRLKKRILVLDRADDIPREMDKLKTAMFAGKGTASTAVLQSHWRTLLCKAYEDLFGERHRKRSQPSPGRRKTISSIGMPLVRPSLVINPERLQQMQEIFSFIDKHFHLNCVNYTTMMNTYERIGEPEKSIALYQKMLEDGIVPDRMCLNSLIKAYGATHNSVEAVRVLDKMVECRVKPDIVTYTNLIHVFSGEGDVDAMMSVYALITKEAIQPTVVTISTLVDGLCKARRLREAVVIFRESRDQGIKLNEFAYNAVIQGVSRKGDIRLARTYLQEMADEGIKPNFLTFKAVLNAITVSGQYNDALDLHAAVTQKSFGDVELSDAYYNALLGTLGNSYSPNYHAGIQIFKEAVMNGYFQQVHAKGKDRYNLTRVSIGCVPFIVQSVLHSYIDRTYSEDPKTLGKRIPLRGVHTHGIVFICGGPQNRPPTSQIQIRQPFPKLKFHLAQEINCVHHRVESALQFLKIRYTVLETEDSVRVVIIPPWIRHWVNTYHRTKMTKASVNGAPEQVFYVYKPGIRVDMPARKYGPRVRSPPATSSPSAAQGPLRGALFGGKSLTLPPEFTPSSSPSPAPPKLSKRTMMGGKTGGGKTSGGKMGGGKMGGGKMGGGKTGDGKTGDGKTGDGKTRQRFRGAKERMTPPRRNLPKGMRQKYPSRTQ